MRRCWSGVLIALVAAALVVPGWDRLALAAPPWPDATSDWWLSSYGITEAQVATVADGYEDGTFKPTRAVSRGQLAKMAVNGFVVAPASPATPTFRDVPPSHVFYPYVEGAYAASLVNGYVTQNGLYFRPDSNICRQQAFAIVGRYLSGLELELTGVITGDVTTYGSLLAWYKAEGGFYLNGYLDAASVAAEHRATTAYLIYRRVVKGDNGRLNPLSTITRSQAVALILRARSRVLDTVPPTGVITAPVVLAGEPDAAVNSGSPVFTATTWDDRSGIKEVVFQYGEGSSPATWNTIFTDDQDDDLTAAGFQASCLWGTLKLPDGQYVFRAIAVDQAGNQAMLGSVPVTVDTRPPTAQIAPGCLVPQGADGIFYSVDPKPLFGGLASDLPGGAPGSKASGVVRVEFLYAPVTDTLWPYDRTHFTLISWDLGNSGYASYPDPGIPEGHYVFAVVAVDRAGNSSALLTAPYNPGPPVTKPPYDATATREVVIGVGPN